MQQPKRLNECGDQGTITILKMST